MFQFSESPTSAKSPAAIEQSTTEKEITTNPEKEQKGTSISKSFDKTEKSKCRLLQYLAKILKVLILKLKNYLAFPLTPIYTYNSVPKAYNEWEFSTAGIGSYRLKEKCNQWEKMAFNYSAV